MRKLVVSVQNEVHQFWERIREWCGDSSYERYQRAMARKREPLLLSPQNFMCNNLNGSIAAEPLLLKIIQDLALRTGRA